MQFDGRLLAGVTVFAAVVETGNFARAGRILGMSDSGVGRAVARLEARLGVRLLERTTRSMLLTEEGRLLYERVGANLADIEEVATEIAGATEAARGRLRVDLDPYLSRAVLADHLATFLAEHPLVTLDLVARERVGDLVADGIDVAIRFGEPPDTASIVAVKLLETRIITAASPAYLARHGRPAEPAALREHDCLCFRDPTTGRPFAWEFQRPGETVAVDVSGRVILSEVASMLSLCVGGGGIAQVMALSAQHLLDDGRLVDLFPDWPDERFPLYALFPAHRRQPVRVRAFLAFVRRHLPRGDGAEQPAPAAARTSLPVG